MNMDDTLLLKQVQVDVDTLRAESRSGQAEYTPNAWTKSGNVD
ncbi:hypothetical protein BH762_gp021 [Gordonia phage OneUp]|uniref:Uncharacterized protein n=2 Tax=Oneupvirus TaxID=2733200 RepID=A0A166Y9Q1_9CAUD|nr:hypothetical protein BH762_gp021 [Gordonia phage OneUp]YP_009820674.1 hypothetical protein HOV26_gp022 [Gordonia phage BrutonGaster]ANA86497.1 hypothetical protein PBI_ONEUP_164 [Gordonia phage OneUp]QBP33374.1 hypothetical protein SEA_BRUTONGASTER_160 [Gordonia phage BrutonGaster]